MRDAHQLQPNEIKDKMEMTGFQKVTGFLTLGVLIVSIGCGSGTSAETAKDSKVQDKFFVAVQSGDPGEVINLFHPDLRNKVDEAVVKSWIDVFNATHGEYKGMSWSDFKTGFRVGTGGKEQYANGTFNFARGTAKADFVYNDSKLVRFNIDQPDEVWNQIFPKIDPKAYADLSQRFIEAMFTGNFDDVRPDTFFSDDDDLLQKLESLSQDTQAGLGKLKSAKLLHSQWLPTDIPTDWRLTSIYECEAEKGTQNVLVGMGLKGMKGLITTISLSARKDFPIDKDASQVSIAAIAPLLKALGDCDSSSISMALDELDSQAVVDPPTAFALCQTMQKAGGDFIEVKDTTVSLRFTPSMQMRVVSATFAHASESYELDVFLSDASDKLIGIECEQLSSVGWGENLVLDSYQQRGEQLLRAFHKDPQAAWAMMQKNLQALISIADIEATNAEAKKLGSIQSTVFKRHELGRDKNGFLTIDFFYDVTYEKSKNPLAAEVRFVFPEYVGQILGFKRGF